MAKKKAKKKTGGPGGPGSPGSNAMSRKAKAGLTKSSTPLSAEKKEEFIAHLSRGYSVAASATRIGFSRVSMYDHRRRDAEFKERWDQAVEAGTDILEDEALRRAKDGWQEPVFYKGEEVATINKYSDTLLIFLLKGRRPEKFKERHEHSGPDGEPLKLEVEFV